MADHHQQSSLVTSFVLSNQPKTYLEALTLLASLAFPVADMETFTKQVEAIANTAKESGKTATTLLHTTLGSLDFPIQSPRGAMEKFHAKITQLEISDRLSPPDPPIGRPRTGVLAEYIKRFGLRCGLAAYDVYLEQVLRGGPTNPFAEFGAYLAGLSRGRRCEIEG